MLDLRTLHGSMVTLRNSAPATSRHRLGRSWSSVLVCDSETTRAPRSSKQGPADGMPIFSAFPHNMQFVVVLRNVGCLEA